MKTVTYSEALETILNNIRSLDVEEKALAQAEGQVLAGDVRTEADYPLKAISGPDGYAVRAEDIKSAGKDRPVVLKIIDTVRAGRLSRKTVKPGTAIRIMTGSVVPDGADCVVPFEETDEPGNKSGPNPARPTAVKVYFSPAPGSNIIPAGSAVKKGEMVIPGGTLIGLPQISALASTGISRVKVVRRPRAAIITTGDELVRLGATLSPAKTYNSNEVALRSLVAHCGGLPRVLGIARDSEPSLAQKIEAGLAMDVVLTTGGVSKGDYDLVRRVLGQYGEILFAKINPGPAFAFGLLERTADDGGKAIVPVFAIEGPPSGCLIDFEMLVRPALQKMRGIKELAHPAVMAVSREAVTNTRPGSLFRWTVLQQTETGYSVSLKDGVNPLYQKAAANSLTIIPPGAAVRSGEKIPVWPLDWFK